MNANTMDKLPALAASATPQRQQWHVVPIERQGVKLTALDLWIDGKFGLSDGSGIVAWFTNRQDARVACQALNVASATPRTEQAEGRELLIAEGEIYDAREVEQEIRHEFKSYTPPAGDGALVTDSDGDAEVFRTLYRDMQDACANSEGDAFVVVDQVRWTGLVLDGLAGRAAKRSANESLPDFLDREATELVCRDTLPGSFAVRLAEVLRGRATILRAARQQEGA